MFKKTINLSIVALLIAISLPIKRADAIPAFARKYKFSCSTCHVAIPKLKDYGNDVVANGFKIPDGEEPKRAYIDTGDETLLLMRELPLAIRFDAFVQAADRDNAKTDFQTPYGIKLLSGGPISKHISYYFYFYISERGEVAGVEDAFVYFNDIAKTDLDLSVGQFQVSDPLFKRELRLTYEDYPLYKMKPVLSDIDLTYDRGLMATYGLNFGLDVTAMVLNGNGIGDAGDDLLFDKDNYKSYALRLIQGLSFVNIGLFAYSGKETIGDTLNTDNNVLIYGPDITIGNDNIELNAQYLYREDKFNRSGKQKMNGMMAELMYFPKGDQSKFIYSLLYNKIDDDTDYNNYETGTFSISHMVARNIRFLAEFTYDIVNEKTRFTAGVVAAF
jgi:hypothetical protein